MENLILEVEQGINQILSYYSNAAIRVIDLNFTRLPLYYAPAFLKKTSVVVLESIPMPEFNSMDIFNLPKEFITNIMGITYNNTYFVKRGYEFDESLHFHELVHVIQWQKLGVKKFLYYYIQELIRSGYNNNLFEKMAYKHQSNFDNWNIPYNVITAVKTELKKKNYVDKK